MVGERNLIAEEQGRFRRGRGCWDQLPTLMLLGQIKAMLRRGMFAGFIDFRKAYHRVDGRNCGAVWKVWEWEVVYLPF